MTYKQKYEILLEAIESIAAEHLEPFCPELFDDVLEALLEDTRIARKALKKVRKK